MKLIEADKVKRVMKDYWKAQVDKALTLTFTDGNEANKRINSYLEHNHELLKAIDELPPAEPKAISKWKKEFREYVDSLDITRDDWKGIIEYIGELPPAQPEQHTCVNCDRTVNNGGWYADGRTRCPIEEHYALPKDGYCHLWEKRNVTDDNYPERREE